MTKQAEQAAIKKPSRLRSIYLTLVLPVSLFTLLADVMIGFNLTKQIYSSEYPKVMGTITVSKMDDSYNGNGMSKQTAVIRYDYNVNGKNFVGGLCRYATINTSQELLATYKAGDTVTVYYNPKNPKDAILLPGVGAADWKRLVLETFFNLALIIAWIFYFKNRTALKELPTR